MSSVTPDRQRVASSAERARDGGSQATVFGMDVHSETRLAFLDGSAAEPTGRTLAISVQSAGSARSSWPTETELVCDQHQPDGSVAFRIEAHPQAGYCISGPEYGSHVLSREGHELRCFPEGRPSDAWQRLLIAQVLPFAALLHGLEIFHASAVVHEQRAIAFLGPSHAGKTSLALALCRRGASFLADDVLAVEPQPEGLLAHPGTPLAGVDLAEIARLDATDSNSYREIVATNARERLVRVSCAAAPRPLAALFLLERRADGPERPRFETNVDARALLTASFNFVLATPARLQGLLDVCALAARRRVERIVVGPETDPSGLSAAIEQRLSTSS
jgi:hypothetical protein